MQFFIICEKFVGSFILETAEHCLSHTKACLETKLNGIFKIYLL